MNTSAHRRLRRPTVLLAAVLAATALAATVLAACTQDVEGTGEPVSRSASSGDAVGGVASLSVPKCPEFSDEHACLFIYNNASGFSSPGTRGGYPITMEKVQVHVGHFHWGPTDKGWEYARDNPASTSLLSGTRWRLEFNDGGERQAHGDVWLGSETPGEIQLWAVNNGGIGDDDTYAGCRGTDYVRCDGWKAEGSEDPDEEAASFAYNLRNAPIAVGLTNNVADSQLVVDSVDLGGPIEAPAGTDLRAGGALSTSTELWWSGYRSLTNDGANTITIRATLRSNKRTDKWDGSRVTLTVKTGSKGVEKEGTTCTVSVPSSTGVAAKCGPPTWSSSADVHSPIRLTANVYL